MTGKTADRFGIKDRGVLKEGGYADVTVFGYDGIKVDPSVPDFTPGGIKHVYNNGTAAVKDGVYGTRHAGRIVLRKKEATIFVPARAARDTCGIKILKGRDI